MKICYICFAQDFCEWYRDVADASTSMISTSAGFGGYINTLLACKGTFDPGQLVGECRGVLGWRERKKTCARHKGISLAIARGMVGRLKKSYVLLRKSSEERQFILMVVCWFIISMKPKSAVSYPR